MDYEELLMEKTAWYYYLENMTQQKISELLGISRMRVIQLLNKARKDGVVQFKIRHNSARRMETERDLIDVFGLNDAFVVPTNPIPENNNETVAKAAAMYIQDRLEPNAFINIGYGDTPSRVLNNLANMAENPISVVSLTGGVRYYLPNTQSNIFNARLYLLPTPLLASSKEMAEAMLQEASVKEVMKLASMSPITVVGIGGITEESTVMKSGIMGRNDFLLLKMRGAAGDILCHFINKDGEPVDTDIEDRLISTPLSTLKTLKNVIGVAAGKSKVEAISAALAGQYLNVLITDEETALQLIAVKRASLEEKSERIGGNNHAN